MQSKSSVQNMEWADTSLLSTYPYPHAPPTHIHGDGLRDRMDKFNELQNFDAALHKRLRSARVDTRIDPFR